MRNPKRREKMAGMQSMPTRTSDRNCKYQYLTWAIKDVCLSTVCQ